MIDRIYRRWREATAMLLAAQPAPDERLARKIFQGDRRARSETMVARQDDDQGFPDQGLVDEMGVSLLRLQEGRDQLPGRRWQDRWLILCGRGSLLRARKSHPRGPAGKPFAVQGLGMEC